MGSYASVVTLFSDVTKSLSDKVSFGHGSADDFNSIKDKKWPYDWLDPLTGGFPNQPSEQGSGLSSTISWNVSLNLLDLDDRDGNEEQTARVWDEQFTRMEAWLHKLDRFFMNSYDEPAGTVIMAQSRINSETVRIENPTFISRRKGMTDFPSGWTLAFTLITPSDFDYCTIYE